MQHQQDTFLLPPNEAQNRKKDWLECLPSNLSDLFYYLKKDGDLERVSTYSLKLTEEDISHLKLKSNQQAELQEISIDMGCKKNSKETFAPMFTFHFQDEFQNEVSLAFGLRLQKESNTTHSIWNEGASKAESKGHQLTEITKSIGELFAQKWNELTDLEMGHAFSGITYERLTVPVSGEQQNIEKMRRVRSYRFPKEDASKILDYITSIEPPVLPVVNVMLGAGLIVRVNHPFNFRPIIFTGPTDQTRANSVGTYFERARPCPPFCKD